MIFFYIDILSTEKNMYKKNYRSVMKYYGLLILCMLTKMQATTFTVTNTNDSGVGSLRQAMLDAQTDPTPPSLIDFSISGVNPQTITPLTTLPTIQTPTQIDGTTQQAGWVPGDDMPIVIDCSQLALSAPRGFCFLIDSASNCLIRGLAIKSYVGGAVNGNAIRIRSTTATADNNHINNCFFGCDADGSVTGPFTDNTRSIVLRGNATYGVTNTIIGGPNAGDGNLLVNASVNAITIEFNAQNTLIQNNLFGTDKTGMIAVGENPYDIAIFGYDGVNLNVPCNNTIIRSNVLANNADATAAAINLVQNVNNTIIDNNKIGTNSAGTAALENQGMGINTFGSTDLEVVGTQITNNIISGNPQGGIVLNDLTNNSVIKNNIIGLDATGTTPIANSIGLVIQADTGGPGNPCTGNIIGASGAGNVISGNTANGIMLMTDVLNTVIQSNNIGTGADGVSPLGNGGTGIYIQGTLNAPCTGNLIGGTVSGEGNIIANNGFLGVRGSPIGYDGSPTPAANSPMIMITKAGPAYGVGFSGDPTTPDILNAIIGNSIYHNNGNGINLTNNANDNQQGPTITSASACNNQPQLVISGIAPALPAGSFFRLEFFTNPTDTSPNTEGKQLVGVIPSIASGQSFSLPFTSLELVSPGSFLTATATNLNNAGQPGDTSEFTANFMITPVACGIISPISAAIMAKYCS